MTESTVLTKIDPRGVATVTLNRPEKHNAFDDTIIAELRESFDTLAEREDVRVVILASTGKSFSAGADLGWMKDQADLSLEENAKGADYMARMFLAIARCKKPVVGRIHGHALGGGSGLTAAVDIAICTEDCLFGMTEVKLAVGGNFVKVDASGVTIWGTLVKIN